MNAAVDMGRTQQIKAGHLRLMRYAALAASVAIGFLFWQFLDLVTGGGGLVFAGPLATLSRLWETVSSGVLFQDLLVTGTEFVIAGILATIFGIAIGVLTGYFRPIGVLMEPWLAAGYSTPLIALTPLFILWFGIGIWSKVAVVFIVMVFPILINTALGVSSADPALIDVMRSLRATTWQIIRKIILRGSIPHITTGLRLAVGRGFTAVVAAELLGSNAGMGYRILVASQTFDVPLILAYVLVLAVLGATLMLVIDALNRRIATHRA